MLNRFVYVLIASLLAGCSFYTDQKISSTVVKHGIFEKPVAYYCNNAIYATKDRVYEGRQTLVQALNYWKNIFDKSTDRPNKATDVHDILIVRLSTSSKDAFAVDYLDKDKNLIGRREFTKGNDYEIDSDGVVEIKVSSSCDSHGGPGLGCQWTTNRVFEDQAGNLALIESHGGGGVVGFVPVAVGSKYLSIFPPFADTGTDTGILSPANIARAKPVAACPDTGPQAPVSNFEAARQKAAPRFAVGDVIVPYRKFDYQRNMLVAGASEEIANTKWKVIAITEQYVRLELIAGEAKSTVTKGKTYAAGSYTRDFSSSLAYRKAFPDAGNLGQVSDEFKKDTVTPAP